MVRSAAQLRLQTASLRASLAKEEQLLVSLKFQVSSKETKILNLRAKLNAKEAELEGLPAQPPALPQGEQQAAGPAAPPVVAVRPAGGGNPEGVAPAAPVGQADVGVVAPVPKAKARPKAQAVAAGNQEGEAGKKSKGRPLLRAKDDCPACAQLERGGKVSRKHLPDCEGRKRRQGGGAQKRKAPEDEEAAPMPEPRSPSSSSSSGSSLESD